MHLCNIYVVFKKLTLILKKNEVKKKVQKKKVNLTGLPLQIDWEFIE